MRALCIPIWLFRSPTCWGSVLCLFTDTPPSKAFLLPHTDSWALTLPGAWTLAGDATRITRVMHGLSECLSELQGPVRLQPQTR